MSVYGICSRLVNSVEVIALLSLSIKVYRIPYKTVPVTLEEYFDEALGCAIIKVRAEFAGPLSGVKEFAWGDSAGVWSRLTLDKLEGHLGSIDIDGDETLTVELDVAVAMVQSAFPVVVNFDGG